LHPTCEAFGYVNTYIQREVHYFPARFLLSPLVAVMPSAVWLVLSNTELLEAILLQLPIYDLLVNAQRVNRTFYNNTRCSPSLQCKLFFSVPSTKSEISDSKDTGIAAAQEPIERDDVEFNPFLQRAFPPWFSDMGSASTILRLWGIREFRALDWNRSEARTNAYSRADASWRRMLVSQPAVTSLEIVRKISQLGVRSEQGGELHFQDGIRMGTLYDLVENHIFSKSPICSFALRWPGVANYEITQTDGKVKRHLSLILENVAQCLTGTSGKGYYLEETPEQKAWGGSRLDQRRQVEPWRFRSQGYQEIRVDFVQTPHGVIGASASDCA
jgi:hypothetical protein